MAIYDKKPSIIEEVGNGSYLYRWGIKSVEMQNEDINTDSTPENKWECSEVTVWSPLSSNRITQAVLTSIWVSNDEQKLVNEYNAAQLGMYGQPTSGDAKLKINAYKDFLSERANIKAQIDKDCNILGIK